MGVADVRAAFNAIAGNAGVTCARAELGYEEYDGRQWQRLVFRGTDNAGQPFLKMSERLPPETDLIAEAQTVAKQIISGGENG